MSLFFNKLLNYAVATNILAKYAADTVSGHYLSDYVFMSLTKSESVGLWPEVWLVFFLLPSFLFVVRTYFSTNNLFVRLTATESFLNFLVCIVLALSFAYLYRVTMLMSPDNSFIYVGFFFNSKFMISAAIMYIKLVLSLATVVALLFIKLSNAMTRPYLRIFPEYFLFTPEILLILMINYVFSLFLVSSADFFIVILFLQGLTITNYFLFLGANSKASIANTLNYFIFSSWVLVLLLLSAFLIYSVCGSLNFFVVSDTLTNLFECTIDDYFDSQETPASLYFQQSLVVGGSFFFIFSLFFKLGLSPLHPVTINVCSTMPKPFLYVTMITNKFTIFVLLAKVVLTVFADLFFYWRPIFFIVGSISIFYGTLQSLYSDTIKLWFAYNMLQSTGFLILAMSLCFSYPDDYTASSNALTLVSQYFVAAFLGWGIFFFIWIYCNGVLARTWKIRKSLTYVSDFNIIGVFLKFRNPVYKIALSLSLLNSIGFPPTLIFITKYFILADIAVQFDPMFVIFFLLLFVLSSAKVFEILRFIFLFQSTSRDTKILERFLEQETLVGENTTLYNTKALHDGIPDADSKFYDCVIFLLTACLILVSSLSADDFARFLNKLVTIFLFV